MKETYKNVPVRKQILFCIMKQLLSLKHINENSSYPVETAGEDGFYQFFTDEEVHYPVGFMEDDILLSRNSYQLIIANINNHKSPVTVKDAIPLLPSLMNFSEITTQHCSISARLVTAGKVCVTGCLSIGFPLIIGRLCLQ